MTSPQELESIISSGLLCFPLTDFDAPLRFAPKPYSDRLELLMPYGATALFAAGVTGEFFSLEPQEFSEVIKTAIETCRGRLPILAGAGGGTTLAIRYSQEVERCTYLIGFKDGVGDIEKFVAIRQTLGDRYAYLGGLPTAEPCAGATRPWAARCTRRQPSTSSHAPRWISTTRMRPATAPPATASSATSSCPTSRCATRARVMPCRSCRPAPRWWATAPARCARRCPTCCRPKWIVSAS